MIDSQPSLFCVVNGGIGDEILTLPALRFLRESLRGFRVEVGLGGWKDRRRLFGSLLGVPLRLHSLESLWLPRSEAAAPEFDWVLDLEFTSAPRGIPTDCRVRSGWVSLPRRFERPDSLPVAVRAEGFARQCFELACRFLERLHGTGIGEAEASRLWERHRPHPLPDTRTPERRRVQARLASLAAGRPRLAVSPGGRNPREKIWPAGCFAEVARHALSRGVDVFLLGAASEQGLHREIAERIREAGRARRPPREGRLHSLAGWPLEDLPYVLAAMGLHLSNDSGAAHIGGALDRRQVVLYRGSESPHRTLGVRDTCLFSGNPAGTEQICTGEVIGHVERWIDETSGEDPGGPGSGK